MTSCKYKYRVRWFHSKGAFLILVWSVSVGMMTWFVYAHLARHPFPGNNTYITPVSVAGVLAAPLFGWLADAKLGNYRVLRYGLRILFLAMVLTCSCLVMVSVMPETVFSIMICISYFGLVVGICAYFATSLQLGLDQMLGASASSITSFITCYLLSIIIGCFVSEVLYNTIHICTDKSSHLKYTQIWSLFLAICISTALLSDILLTPRWLLLEPKSPQSLRRIYHVLKFAAKHKAPLNRSAFTYWEEEIPSRIDLGKEKYGGPFTTEQVEDVKTILRLLLVSASLCIIASSEFLHPDIPLTPNTNASLATGLDYCEKEILSLFTYNNLWCTILLTLVYELVIYPLFRSRIPSILKRIGMVSLASVTINLLLLILKMIEYFQGEIIAITWTSTVLYWSMHGFIFQILLTTTLEFFCAQSPYNMRGLSVGYMTTIATISGCLGQGIHVILNLKAFIKPKLLRSLIILLVNLLLSLVGFIVHCVVARWYKMRERDNDYFLQREVENVFDRYLTQQEI